MTAALDPRTRILAPGTLGLQQRIVPMYRVPLFERLAAAWEGGLEICAGGPDRDEGVKVADDVPGARWTKVTNVRMARGAAHWQRGAVEWAKRSTADTFVLEGIPRLVSNAPLRRVARRRGIALVAWGGAFLSEPQGMKRAILTRWLEGFDAIVVYGTKAREDHIALGLDPDLIFVAPNSVATAMADRTWESLQREPQLRATWRAELALDDRPVVLSVGRVLARKRLDVLIDAAAKLPVQLVIAGDGPDLESTKAHARRAGVDARFPGDVRGDALARYFAASDLFVLPGLGGLALHEAIAYGKPVIATKADGIERDLVRRENGRIVAPGDPKALADAMAELIADPSRLRAMGAASRRIVETSWNLDETVRGLARAVECARGRSL